MSKEWQTVSEELQKTDFASIAKARFIYVVSLRYDGQCAGKFEMLATLCSTRRKARAWIRKNGRRFMEYQQISSELHADYGYALTSSPLDVTGLPWYNMFHEDYDSEGRRECYDMLGVRHDPPEGVI